MVLCTIAPFGTVGQKHPGVLGFLQEKVIACMDNIWFDRSVRKQKSAVSQRIKDHIADPSKARLLIFPEGFFLFFLLFSFTVFFFHLILYIFSLSLSS